MGSSDVSQVEGNFSDPGESVSGICGICQSGAENRRETLDAMLASLVISEESVCDSIPGSPAALGVISRWPSQQVAAIPKVRIALDADLIGLAGVSQRLSVKGFDPSRMSLAEQVATLYVLRGVDFVQDLQGAFALALWDEENHRLVLAVDRMGLKSLYWTLEGGRFIFSTRPRAIRAGQSRPALVNPAAILQYLLFSVVPAPLSVYQGIERLLPGQLLQYENGQVSRRQYWDVSYEESSDRNVENWAERVREGLRDAVHAHLEGCNNDTTGAYLSGGTDSSSVVAFMSEKFAPVHTFSISFFEERYDESRFARVTAERFRARHHEKCLTPNEAWNAISLITQYYDEPFANSSAVGAYYCAQMARECGVTTLLAGDGGDELFAGNERYASDKYFALYHSVPAWFRRGVLEPVSRMLPKKNRLLSLPGKYICRASIPNPRRIFSYGLFLTLKAEEVFERDFLEQVPPERWLEIAERHFNAPSTASELNRLLYLDLKLTLADNDVRKVSGTAELAGVRVRYPLMDYKLAEMCGRIPTRLKLKGFEKRYIFKQAMRAILPEEVLYKKKHGFGVPLGVWFLREPRLRSLAQDVLADARTRQRGYFRADFIDRLRNLHQLENSAYYGEVVWYLIVLELWHRQHLEKETNLVCVP
jgi:asparagine synthase (glutamine-hydrolysing)